MQKMVYGIIWQMLQLHSEWGRVEHGGNFMSMAGSEACKDFRNPERSASTSKLKAGPYLDSSSNKTILSRFFPSNSRHCRLIQSPASCARKSGGTRKKFGPFERKDIRSAVVRLHPSVMLMTLPWVSVPMSSRMRHLVGVAFWTRCPWRQGLAVNCGTGDHVTNMYM